MRNDEHGRLDRAIDRAVRGMMEVDPASGLRHRVTDRLQQPGRPRWLLPAVAAACVLLATSGIIVLLRPASAVQPAAPSVATSQQAPPAAATAVAGAESPARPTTTSTSSPRPKPDATDRRQTPSANPIFGASDGRVTAADVGASARGGARPSPTAALQSPPPGIHTANIKLELTITDQGGGGDPVRKTYSMIVADGARGTIRTAHDVRGQGPVQVNFQASPQTLPGGGIRVQLDVDYNPRALAATAPAGWSSMSQQIQVVLEPGKPQVVTQTADPASDRRILIELRATIVAR